MRKRKSRQHVGDIAYIAHVVRLIGGRATEYSKRTNARRRLIDGRIVLFLNPPPPPDPKKVVAAIEAASGDAPRCHWPEVQLGPIVELWRIRDNQRHVREEKDRQRRLQWHRIIVDEERHDPELRAHLFAFMSIPHLLPAEWQRRLQDAIHERRKGSEG